MKTPNIELPELAQFESPAYVNLNDGFRALDTVVQLTVTSRSLATPPTTAEQGDRYIVASGPTGSWIGHTKHIAYKTASGWDFRTPRKGWTAFVTDEETDTTHRVAVYFDGLNWVDLIYAYGLSDLPDVDFVTPPADGDALVYDGGLAKWVALQIGRIDVIEVGSPGVLVSGVTALQFSGDVTVDQIDSITARVTVTATGGGGGGSSGGGNLTPDSHPDVPNAIDDEFEGASLDPKWTITRGTVTTTSVSRGALYIVDSSNSADNWAGYGQSISGTFKVRAKFWVTGEGVDNRGGIYIARGGNKFMVFGVFNNSGNLNYYVNKMTTVTGTGVANLFIANAGVSTSVPRGAGPFYIQVEYDGTNVKFYGSLVGYDGYFGASSGSEAVATFLGGAPDEIGVYSDRGSSNGNGALFDWFRGGF